MALIFLLAGCTQLGLYALNFPAAKDVSIVRDVPFGKGDWQKLDIYRPADKNDNLDVIVFYYGGRWETGNRDDFKFVGENLARKGFVVVIPDYRKYPQVRFPVFVEDAAQSLAWVSNHIGVYGGSSDKIHVAGHSAGAHIGALLTADERFLKKERKNARQLIKSFAGLAGPYDFTPEDEDLVDIFGPPARYPAMRATSFIDGREPPMLLLWGADDDSVRQFNLDRLKNKIIAKGGCVDSRIYADTGHISILTSLSWIGSKKTDVANDMAAFFRQPVCIRKK